MSPQEEERDDEEELVEDDDQVEEDDSPPPKGPVMQQPTPKRPSGAQRRKASRAAPGKGTGRPSGPLYGRPDPEDRPTDADMLWPHLLERIKEEFDKSAYDINIRVKRISEDIVLGNFAGEAALGGGDMTPGDALRNVVIDRFHMGYPRGPADYQIYFTWKRGGGMIDHGKLRLPAREEIAAMRASAGFAPSPYGPPPGVGAPQQQQQQAPQQTPFHQPYYPGYGWPVPQQQPVQAPAQNDELLKELREQNRLLHERLNRIEQQQNAPRPYAPPAPPIAAPVRQEKAPLSLDDVTALTKVLESTLGLTIVPKQQAGVGAPAATPVMQQPVAAAPAAPAPRQRSRGDVIEELLTEIEGRKKLEARLKAALGVDIKEADDEEEEEEKKKPEEEGLGKTIKLGAKWKDGTDIVIIRDDDGNIDGISTVGSNPYLVERFGDSALGIVDKLLGGKLGIGQGPSVQQQQPQQQPQQMQQKTQQQLPPVPPVQPPQPAAPIANGAGEKKGEWDF